MKPIIPIPWRGLALLFALFVAGMIVEGAERMDAERIEARRP